MTINPSCWLAEHGVHESGEMPPCSGRLVRCHLLPRQVLKKVDIDGTEFDRPDWSVDALIDDPRTWVWGCGGVIGNGGHHGMLDQSRKLRIPFEELPLPMVRLAVALGLGWFLDREYDRG